MSYGDVLIGELEAHLELGLGRDRHHLLQQPPVQHQHGRIVPIAGRCRQVEAVVQHVVSDVFERVRDIGEEPDVTENNGIV